MCQMITLVSASVAMLQSRLYELLLKLKRKASWKHRVKRMDAACYYTDVVRSVLVTPMSLAKTAEPIEIRDAVWRQTCARVGQGTVDCWALLDQYD